MSNKLIVFIKNFSYTLSSNVVSFLINIIILLTVPKVIGVTEYGYFQYYTLLTSYLFVLHFGWIDGIYLRYGGTRYEKLNQKQFSQQFWCLIIFCVVQILLYLILLNNLGIEENKYIVILYSILSIILVLPRTFISITLQISNRMKEYSLLLISERIFYAIILITMLFYGVRSFKILLMGDLCGKIVSLIYGIKVCKNIVFMKPEFNKKTFTEVKINVSTGVFLVLSNLCALLVTSIVQFFIEQKWNIETFSKVSLTFNISRMLMLVVNSVAIVMFPLIKNENRDTLPKLYMQIRKASMILLLAILIFYYPLRVILTFWLPQYSDSFKYVALLLPMSIFESKSVMLVSTYLKALRRETTLFMVNFIVVIISCILSFITVYMLSSLELAVLSITIVLIIKSILLEFFASKLLSIRVFKDTIIELIIVAIFISSGWFINSWLTSVIYLCLYIIYLYSNRNYIKSIKTLIHIRRNN